MKRTLGAEQSGGVAAAIKRPATDTLTASNTTTTTTTTTTSSSSSPSSAGSASLPSSSAVLRVGLFLAPYTEQRDPGSDTSGSSSSSSSSSSGSGRGGELYDKYFRRQQFLLCRNHHRPASLRSQKLLHIALPSASTDSFWDLILLLHQDILVLSHCTVTSITDDSTLCQSASFDTQESFDAAVAALPLNTPLRVSGVTAGFHQQQHLLEEVHMSFEATLSEATEPLTDQVMSATCFDSCCGSHASRDADSDTATGAAGSHRTSPSDPPPTLPRVAQHIADQSVRLTTSFRLLPSLSLPLSLVLGSADDGAKRTAARVCPDADRYEKAVIVFHTDHAFSSGSPPATLSDVLAYHRERDLAAGVDGFDDTGSAKQLSEDSVFSAFLARHPTARVSSFALCCVPSHYYHPFRLQVGVQSDADMQLRGFHIVRPRLRFVLHRPDSGEQRSAIEGKASASYSIRGQEAEAVQVLVDVTFTTGQDPLLVKGDSLNVMRMADVLKAHISREREPPPLTGSFTTLSWTLDSLLARQLPWLVPYDSQEAEHEHRVTCSYALTNHAVCDVGYSNITLALIAPSSSSSASSALPVLLSRPTRHFDMELTQFQLSLSPQPTLRGNHPHTSTASTASTKPLMSFTQLLRLANLPVELVPAALLDRLQFDNVTAQLLINTATGVALCVAGRADCGEGSLLFFSRLAPAAQLPARRARSKYHYSDRSGRLLRSPVNQWLRLHCRSVLDPAVFPQLASLTAGVCLEPLYHYMRCETEGPTYHPASSSSHRQHSL